MAKFNKSNQDEIICEFTRSMKGYNPTEVEDFIQGLVCRNNNTIKVYEEKVDQFKEENEIFRCENDNYKQELLKRQKLTEQLQQQADLARKELLSINKKFSKVEEVENEIKEKDKTIAKLEKEKEESERALLVVNVDKKNLKEKLEKAKAEISDLKNKIKEMQENPQTVVVEEKSKGKYISNEEEIQQMIGSYSLHLMKTRKILDQLIEQVSDTEELF